MAEAISLSQAVDRYIGERAAKGTLSANSVRTMGSILRRFVAHVGDRPVNELEWAHVEAWRETNSVQSRQSRYNQLATLRGWLRWLAEEGHADVAAVLGALVQLPPVRRRSPLSRSGGLRAALVARGLGPRSVQTYLYAIRAAESWFEARGQALADAHACDIAEYLATKPASWASRNLLRAAFTHYWAIQGREDPPLAAIRVPPVPQRPCRALSEAEARVLARACRARCDRRGLAVALGLYGGLRCEEIATLKGSDFTADGWLVVTGKGEKT